MSNMVFYSKNLISASSDIFVNRISTTAHITISADNTEYLYDNKTTPVFTWSNTGYTATSLIISLSTTAEIDTITLRNNNLKSFYIYVLDDIPEFASTSAVMTILNGKTTTTQFSNNNEKNLFMELSTTSGFSYLQIQVNSTTSGGDPEIGEILIGTKVLELPRNPAFADYKPLLKQNRNNKIAADGGSVFYRIPEKFETNLKLTYANQSVASTLLNMYQTSTSYNFIPFPTHTSWDAQSYEVNWINDFEFYQMAINDRSEPLYTGKIQLKETAG